MSRCHVNFVFFLRFGSLTGVHFRRLVVTRKTAAARLLVVIRKSAATRLQAATRRLNSLVAL